MFSCLSCSDQHQHTGLTKNTSSDSLENVGKLSIMSVEEQAHPLLPHQTTVADSSSHLAAMPGTTPLTPRGIDNVFWKPLRNKIFFWEIAQSSVFGMIIASEWTYSLTNAHPAIVHLSEALRKQDQLIETALMDKHRIIAEMLGMPPDEFENIAEVGIISHNDFHRFPSWQVVPSIHRYAENASW